MNKKIIRAAAVLSVLCSVAVFTTGCLRNHPVLREAIVDEIVDDDPPPPPPHHGLRHDNNNVNVNVNVNGNNPPPPPRDRHHRRK